MDICQAISHIKLYTQSLLSMTNVLQVIKSVIGFDNVGNKSRDSCSIDWCQVWVPEQVSLEYRQSETWWSQSGCLCGYTLCRQQQLTLACLQPMQKKLNTPWLNRLKVRYRPLPHLQVLNFCDNCWLSIFNVLANAPLSQAMSCRLL